MTRRVAAQDALRSVPDGQGRRFNEVFRHGTLFVEIYAPVDRDPQTPHTRMGVRATCTEFASDAHFDNDVSAAAHQALGFEEVEVIRCFRKDLTTPAS